MALQPCSGHLGTVAEGVGPSPVQDPPSNLGHSGCPRARALLALDEWALFNKRTCMLVYGVCILFHQFINAQGAGSTCSGA